MPDADICQGCSLCHPNCSMEINNIRSEVRQGASRENSSNNFLYCPSAVDIADDEVEHFQRHRVNGEPVIVRNVLDRTSCLSWEPMVMWRAFRESGDNVRFKEERLCVKAIDCLDCCKAGVPPFLRHQFEELAKQKFGDSSDSGDKKRSQLVVIGQHCVGLLQALRRAGMRLFGKRWLKSEETWRL